MAVIDARVYVRGEQIGSGMPPADALRLARERDGFVWIALTRTDADELAGIATLLMLHPLAVRDCMRDHQRPKISAYDDGAFLVMQTATYLDDSETVEFAEIDVFVGDDYVVTLADEAAAVDIDALGEKVRQHPDLLSRGSHAVVWALLEHEVSEYAPVVEGVENDIDEIEDQLFADDPGVSHRIFALQREVIDLQHATAPLVGMFERLDEAEGKRLGRPDGPAFRDLAERAQQIAARVDGFRATLGSALNVHATLVEQRNSEAMRRMTEFSLQQNDQVKKVSSWAAILFAPTLVGTIYGMNFVGIPELHWAFGYPFALALMVATSVTLYVVFKKKGWL